MCCRPYLLLLLLPLIVFQLVKALLLLCLGLALRSKLAGNCNRLGFAFASLCRLVFALLRSENPYLCETALHACVLAMAETCQAISALSTIKFVFVLMSSQHDAPFGQTSLYFSDSQSSSSTSSSPWAIVLMTFDSCAYPMLILPFV